MKPARSSSRAALIRLVLVALVAGAMGFGLTRLFAPTPRLAAGNELAWLTQEFQLTPAQAERIAALHAAYRPICADHCAAISEAKKDMANMAADHDHAAMQSRIDQLVTACHDATQNHLEAVAAAMSPEQGQRYLTLIEPRLSAHQHAQPFGLR